MLVLPGPSHRVSGENGIRYHIGLDLKGLVMNGFSFRCCPLCNLGEYVVLQLCKSNLSQGDGQSDCRRKGEYRITRGR